MIPKKTLRSLLAAAIAAITHVALAGDSLRFLDAIQKEPTPVAGEQYYTRVSFMEERGVHMATNYARGTLIPINTKVVLVGLGDRTMLLRLVDSGQAVKVENVAEFTRADIPTIAKRMLSRNPTSLDKFDPTIAAGIRTGILRLGMTKEQAIMARGYPPAHKTSALDLDTWTYWTSRFVTQAVVFEDGVIARGRGIQ